ncbi:MAG: KTSC domain-containing protein [Casimicrobiaceae bacterium]
MKRLSAGNLRAAGYDRSTRTLRVEMSGGAILEHPGVSEDVYRRLRSSASAWSFYRDNIEEDFPATRVR